MNKTYWIEWTKAAGIRALRTFAQTAAATIGTSAVMSSIDWKMVLSTALVAVILSLLASVAGLPEVNLIVGYGQGNLYTLSVLLKARKYGSITMQNRLFAILCYFERR